MFFHCKLLAVSCSNDNFCLSLCMISQMILFFCAFELELFKDIGVIEVLQLLLLLYLIFIQLPPLPLKVFHFPWAWERRWDTPVTNLSHSCRQNTVATQSNWWTAEKVDTGPQCSWSMEKSQKFNEGMF